MRNNAFDIELLRTFVAVVETGGFSDAARKVSLTQAAVSGHVKRLESMVGKCLLERRQGRLMGVTPAGLKMVDYARKLLSLNEEAYLAVAETGSESVVRLGTPEDFATKHLTEVLMDFSRNHRSVLVDVQCDLSANLLRRVERGELDIALVKRQVGATEGISLQQEPLVWVASRNFSMDFAAPVPLVLFPEGCAYRNKAIESMRLHGRAWRVSYTSPSLSGIQSAVSAGLGVSALPISEVVHQHRVLDSAEGFFELSTIELALYIGNRGANAAVECLVDHILEGFNQNVFRDSMVAS